MNEEFVTALKTHQASFGIQLSDTQIASLARYYELVAENNPILHLVGPMPAEEFAIRHILESLTLLEHLPQGSRFADIGSGAGLPSIPCLLVRDDLRADLIDSKIKKAKFLETALEQLGLVDRARVINRQFEEADSSGSDVLTCRALDKFTEKLPRLLRWAGNKRVVLFGGNNLRDALIKNKVRFTTRLMPLSEQRFLFISR